jgi:hypothetical protein
MINIFIFKINLINCIFKWKQLETKSAKNQQKISKKSAKNQQLINCVKIETIYQLTNILYNN